MTPAGARRRCGRDRCRRWSAAGDAGVMLRDVPLTGQLGDALHHLVRQRTRRAAATVHLDIVRRERSPDRDRTCPRTRQAGTRRLDVPSSDDADGQDRATHRDRQTCCTDVPTVQMAVTRSCSFRKDAQQCSAAQNGSGGIERNRCPRRIVPIDGDHPHCRKQPPRLPRVEVLGLADEVDRPVDRHHHHNCVEEAEVVGAQHRRPLARNRLGPRDAHRPQPSKRRTQHSARCTLEHWALQLISSHETQCALRTFPQCHGEVNAASALPATGIGRSATSQTAQPRPARLIGRGNRPRPGPARATLVLRHPAQDLLDMSTTSGPGRSLAHLARHPSAHTPQGTTLPRRATCSDQDFLPYPLGYRRPRMDARQGVTR